MHVNEETAVHIVNDLRIEGYIEVTDEYAHAAIKNRRWQMTLQGNQRALATARKPITRKAAGCLVKAFLQHVYELSTLTNSL